MNRQADPFSHEPLGPRRLEVVTAQVARLETAFQRIRSQTRLLQALASATNRAPDQEFFHAMVRHLTAALEVTATIITRFTDDTRSRLRVLAGIVQGEFLNCTLEYDVPDPLRGLVGPNAPIFLCPTKAGSRVPHRLFTNDIPVDGACLIAVPGTAGDMLGMLLVLHERPLHLTAEVQTLLRLVATWAGAELERRRADAVRDESETRFFAFMHHLPGVVFMKDEGGRHLYVNHAFEQLFGLKRDDWYGKTNEQLFRASSARIMTLHDRAVLHEQKPIHIVENTAQEGTSRTWLVTKFPLRLRQGTPLMVAGIALDITAHQHTLHSLREREDRYGRLVNVCPDGIVIQRDNAIVLANPAALTLFGAGRQEELLGRFLSELFHLDDAAILAKRIRWMLDRRANLPLVEKRIVRLDGTSGDVEMAAALFADGNAQAIQMILRDISQRKWADQVTRTFALDRQRLVEERHKLCVNLHDSLLQHLYAIGLRLDACRAHVEQTPGEARTIIPRTIVQLNGLIQELRQFLLELSAEPWPGGRLTTYLRELMKAIEHPHATRLKAIIDDRVGNVLCSGQCAWIVAFAKEALSNSLRHARATRITLSLRLSKEGVRLTVRDNGIGFAPEVVSRRGCGLTIMTALAQENSGRVKVSSKLGEGTRVALLIPGAPDMDSRKHSRPIVDIRIPQRRSKRATARRATNGLM